MDEPTRRAWSRPELIVLVRSGPEEAVLESCKQASTSYHDVHPDGAYTSCLLTQPEPCQGACSEESAS